MSEKKLASNQDRERENNSDWCKTIRRLEIGFINIKKLDSSQEYTNKEAPMIWVAKNGDLGISQALINAGTDVYIMDSLGDISLSYVYFRNDSNALLSQAINCRIVLCRMLILPLYLSCQHF